VDFVLLPHHLWQSWAIALFENERSLFFVDFKKERFPHSLFFRSLSLICSFEKRDRKSNRSIAHLKKIDRKSDSSFEKGDERMSDCPTLIFRPL